MHTNSLNAMKMLGYLHQVNQEPVVLPTPARKTKKVAIKQEPQDYPYETSDSESTDSETFASSKKMDVLPKHKKIVKKTKQEKPVELPQPPPPPPIQLKTPADAAIESKVPKSRTKKVKEEDPFASAAAPEPVKGTPLAPENKSAKKQKRTPSAYNKFVSLKMKEGLSMKSVAEAWKAEKEKNKSG